MHKNTLSVLLLWLFSSIAVIGQEPPPGFWRIARYNNRNQTVIAVSDKPVTYEVCRSTVLPVLPGKVNPVVNGSVHVDMELEAGSCVILKGTQIGLWSDRTPSKFLHFTGTYKRVDPIPIWSPQLKWLYDIPASNIESTSFPVSIGSKGVYRICQSYVIVGNDEPSAYEVGFHLYVDGTPVAADLPQRTQLIRFTRGNCVDVSGTGISAQIISSEYVRGNGYTGTGFLYYALEK